MKLRNKLYLYNTLGKEKQEFVLPSHVRYVRMYNCGPTVYGVQHIGNLSMFVFTDVLRRTLEKNGFSVKQIINITDFGHLTSDGDEGEDKMTKGLRREGMALTMDNMRKLAEHYTQEWFVDLEQLNIDTTRIEFPRASQHIAAEIAMVKTLEEKGYAYDTPDGVYYDTTRFPAYGALGGIKLEGLQAGVRVATSSHKRHPTDFLLWRKSDGELGWDSPWGKGFPGWHIECSAMIRATLGEQIDIHTGGMEHVAIHHNNEIAQSEAATGKKPLARFWMHRAHIQIDGGKIAKSDGNVVYLSDIVTQGYHPLALRYLFLGAHYRTHSNFSWEALVASQTALIKLAALCLSITDAPGTVSVAWQNKYMERINDDLDTPGALAVLWEMSKDASLSKADLLATMLDLDEVLGLNLANPNEHMRQLAALEIKEEVAITDLPADIQTLIRDREQARSDRRWEAADTIRIQIQEHGYVLEDSPSGPRIFKR